MPTIVPIDPGAFAALTGTKAHVASIEKDARRARLMEDIALALEGAGQLAGGIAGARNAYLEPERRAARRREAESLVGIGQPGEVIRRAPGGAMDLGPEDRAELELAIGDYETSGEPKSLLDVINRQKRDRRDDAREERVSKQAEDASRRADESLKVSKGHLDLARGRENRARGEAVARGAERVMTGLAKLPRMHAARQFVDRLTAARKAEGKGIGLTDLVAIDAVMAGRAIPEPILRTLPGVPPPASAQTAGTAGERNAAAMLGTEDVDWNAVNAVFDTDPDVDADERVLIGQVSGWAAKQEPAAIRKALANLPEDPSRPSPIRGILEGRLSAMVDERVRLAMPSIQQAVATAATDEAAAVALQNLLTEHGVSEDEYAGWVFGQRRHQSETEGWREVPREQERIWARAKPGTVPLLGPDGKVRYVTVQEAEELGFVFR